MSSPQPAAWRRWLPVVLSIGSGLWLFIATGLFVAASSAPYLVFDSPIAAALVFVVPIAAAPGVAQLVTRTPSRALYSAAFFYVLAALVFTVVAFIIYASFALVAPAVCLGVAWRLTPQRTPLVPQPVTSRPAE